jgi:drug/metabolite transporter (DMT)-like permease
MSASTLPAETSQPSRLPAYLALGIGIITLGISAILVRWANAPGAVTSFYRMAIAVVALALPFYQRVRTNDPLPRREVAFALLGGLLFAGDLALWTTGVMISGATNPTLLANTAPLWVGLGAWLFFRERQKRLFWVGLLVAMAGAVTILGKEALEGLSLGLGTLFGLLAGVFYGSYFLATQRGRQRLDSLNYFWISALSSTLFLLLLTLVLRQPLTGYANTTYLNFLAMGLFVQGGGYLAINYALGHLPATLVAPILLGQPVVTAILAWPLLGEAISPLEALGGLAVLAGVFAVHTSQQKRPPSPRS